MVGFLGEVSMGETLREKTFLTKRKKKKELKKEEESNGGYREDYSICSIYIIYNIWNDYVGKIIKLYFIYSLLLFSTLRK